MDWKSVKFDWNQARAFLVTAEEGSLTSAARALGLTQPTLSRQVAALEEELGVSLFERIGRSLALTDAGFELLEHVRKMGEAASRISLSASCSSQAVEGVVTLAVTDLMAAYILPPILKDLRQAAPGIEINLKCSNSISDLRRREADIAIRHVRPEHPELFARKLRDTPARIYASKALLEAYGGAIALQDIPKFDFLGFGNNEELVIGLHGMGLPIRAENIKLGSPSALVVWHLVRSGLGLSVMADEIASKCPDVACALPDLDPVFFPIWLVTHRELHTSRKIRLVFDHLSSELKRHWP